VESGLSGFSQENCDSGRLVSVSGIDWPLMGRVIRHPQGRLWRMIEVTQFHLSKADLAEMPSEERALIFLAGQTLNQINTWLKLIRMSSSSEGASELEQKLSAAQTHILLRALFGTLHEAWVWQTRKDIGPLIGRYMDRLPPVSGTARKVLSKHLARGGTLDGLRNGFSFHSPTTASLDDSFAVIPENEDWSWYVTSEHSTTLMLSCETVLNYGVANMGQGADLNERFRNLLSETITVANAMNEFLTGLVVVALHSNLPNKPRQSSLQIRDAPHLADAIIPFFVRGI
jgi:hypothetical protein